MSNFDNGNFQNGNFDNGGFLGPFDAYGPDSVRTIDLVFSIPAGTTTPIVSAALGWEPKAAIAMSIFRSGTGLGSSPGIGYGMASKEATRENCMTGYLAPNLSAAASTMTRTAIFNDGIIAQVDTAQLGKASISWQDETVTLTPTDAFPANVDVVITILGGPGVRRARAGTWTIASGLLLQSFVDPDFRPTTLILCGSAAAALTLNAIQAGFDMSIAVAINPLEHFCLNLRHQNNAGNPVATFTRATTSRFFVGINTGGAESKVIDLVSFDAGGVTVQGVINSSQSIFSWLALQGPQAAIFNALTQASAGPFDAVTGLPFDPRRVFLFANPEAPANQLAGTEPLSGMLGTSDGAAQHSIVYHSYDYAPIGAGSQTDPLGQRSATRAGNHVSRVSQNVGQVEGDYTVSDLSGGAVELTQQNPDPAQRFIMGLALGDALPLPDPPDPSDVITVRERRQGGFRRRRFL